MNEEFQLEEYLSNGVKKMVKGMIKASIFHPKENSFMLKYAVASQKAIAKRKLAEENGKHIPPFLIASITSMCNLHCAGCYARSVNTCVDGEPVKQLTAQEWKNIFSEAKDLGVGFIILIGGEPMVRRDVISEATKFPEMLFPIFTNGTMINEEYLKLFDNYRNLVPVLSIEGGPEATNNRRGSGMYEKLIKSMDDMKQKKIAFGASITVTKDNIKEVISQKFIDEMIEKGCKVIFYIEFVPVSAETEYLALGDEERIYLENHVNKMRKDTDKALFVSFPGDEKSSGGCLAAGRGFFHINPQGGAEPCPFSPYSDLNVRDFSLEEAMNSKLFKSLRSGDMLLEEHKGGCVLYELKEQVEALIRNK